MADYHHGVRVIEDASGTRPVDTIDSGVVGFVAHADDADATYFPANRPVVITDIATAAGKAGIKGTLASTLDAISDHGSPTMVIVRVPTGASAAETKSNVIGGTVGGLKTGVQALLAAPAAVGVTPRILGAPGLDDADVTAELVAIAQRLRGMVYASCFGCETKEEAIAYRGGFGARELMLLWPDFLSWDTASSSTTVSPAAARALGLRAKLDQDVGWHKTLSNIAVNGVSGISKDVHWQLQDPDTDAGLLNASDVTTIINKQGYRFWGSRTCSDDPMFAFESATRTAQVMADTIAEGVLWAIDKPMHATLARDIVDTINAAIRTLVAEGKLIGGEAWIDPAKNQASDLAAGRLTISCKYTPVPPLENLLLRLTNTTDYLVDFANQVIG